MIDRGFHHDGSADHVSTLAPEPGETVTVFVRTPREHRSGVYVRTTPDGEPHFTEAVVDRETEHELWWRADVVARNPVTRYRFLLTGSGSGSGSGSAGGAGNPPGYRWLTASGLVAHDVPDATDFRLVTHAAPPAWAAASTVYQIFPDRFASSGARRETPEWAIPCDWDDPVAGTGPSTPRQLFGGDLDGIRSRLGHVAGLGADTLYLTPVFPAASNHRYNASSFAEADPLLGGDAAYRALIDDAHRRGMRVLGDLTTNHCGDIHPWFRAALKDKDAPEREMFFFTDGDLGYEAWMGVPSLPKLDWSSERLAAAMEEVVRHWLRFGLDGWRIDVANMTGRLRGSDLTREVARRIRRAVAAERPDGLLVAEHAHDATGDLDADGWQGTMNYAGFTRPVWSWLRGPEVRLPFLGVPAEVPRIGGGDAVATMRAFSGHMSWRALTHSWSILGSHDTARIRTVCGDPALVEVAAGLMFTLPGTPMVFAGDELGLEGSWGEDARRTMPWEHPQAWDTRTLGAYRDLIALRRGEPALTGGGLRWLHVSDDAVAYLRERAGERLLVLAARAAHPPVRLPLGSAATALYGEADLAPDAEGVLTLPADGPAFHVWRLG
ncbi:alpha-amylase family glycosyl hydrolase [Planomonospora venezuelensis]|uniref:Alpha-glucosidase n=1 Tax=Planomonospora venezuelensis TaxID=1999 RepID=A0A841D6V1_PLAVE|nr:alpha-amylase family glycosyl hydrolase [Planomonospora venezuelensis]MBB5964207.1 alpha-glucosidase [Planomonospora venezuelensis]GIN04383.1 alpha-glycosidase [Planomonospora venezuelensis]